MDYTAIFIKISKILAILAGLIAIRVVVQAAMRGRRTSGFLKSLLPFVVPPLVTGGPMLIAIPACMYALREPSVPGAFVLMAFGGAAALALGLGAMFALLMIQQREIARLETLVTGSTDPAP